MPKILGKTGAGTREWWLDPEHTHVATRMGDGRWIPFKAEADGTRDDTGEGPFRTLRETRAWWKARQVPKD